jgi:N-acetylglucosamine kinase-like BadF-type ATPase
MAGAASPATAAALRDGIQHAFPLIGRVEVKSDAFNALNGEVGLSDGIAVIAGTGASAFVRKGGNAARIGGWGYLVDDAGGGFSLGQACLRAAYRALDGRGEKTILQNRVEEILGAPLADAIPDLYAGGAARVAAFAPVAFEAARAGDPVAVGLVESCADEIAKLISVCARRFGPGRAVCALSGSMFRADDFLKRVLQRTETLCLDIRKARLAPVYGALVAAAALVGVEADDAFRKNYERTVPA